MGVAAAHGRGDAAARQVFGILGGTGGEPGSGDWWPRGCGAKVAVVVVPGSTPGGIGVGGDIGEDVVTVLGERATEFGALPTATGGTTREKIWALGLRDVGGLSAA